MINIMVVDNHRLFYEGIKLLLEKENLIHVSCYATSFNESLECLRSSIVDLVLLDINVDNRDGLRLLSFIRKKSIPVKIIVLTGNDDIEFVIKADELDVDGYLLKSISSAVLLDAINDVMNGNRYIQPALIPAINNYLVNNDSDGDKLISLTSREYEILKMIAFGKKNIEIANEMNISERTVKNHLSHIFDKIDVNDRTQAAVFAIKNGVINI